MSSDRVQKGTESDKECVNVAFPERLSVMTDRGLIGCCYTEVRKYNKVNLIGFFCYRYKRCEEHSEWNVVSKIKSK